MKKVFKRNKIVALLVAFVMMFTNFSVAFAATAEETSNKVKVTFSIERRVLGEPDIMSPTEIEVTDGEKTSVVLDRILKSKGMEYDNTGSVENSFYLASICLDPNTDQWLGEFDHGKLSGWMYSVNGVMPNVGMSDWNLKNGDVVRLHYTAQQFGEDIKYVDKVFALREKINNAKTYTGDDYTEESFANLSNVIKTAEKETPSDKQIGEMLSPTLSPNPGSFKDANFTELTSVLNKNEKAISDGIANLKEKPVTPPIPPVEPEKPQVNIGDSINKAGAWMLEKAPTASYGQEWFVLGLSRAGIEVPKDYYENYYTSVEEQVKRVKGKFRKVTDLERIIIALTAIGKDPTNVAGYNLIDNLWNYDNITKQGLNGPVFALIALDTNNYKEPTNAVNTREKLIEEIMKFKTKDGGFSLVSGSDSADVDMTAMTLQALSNYKDNSKAKSAIDSSLKILSSLQLDNGGYSSPWSGENVQSPAQVIVALTALGIDLKDENNGFVKGKGDLLSYVLSYQNKNGAFEHPKDNPDAMATEQGMYTLVAYNRFAKGENKLYDMTDVKISKPEIDKSSLEAALNKAMAVVQDSNFKNIDEAIQNTLASKIQEAEAILDKTDATEEEVQVASKNLDEAKISAQNAINAYVNELNKEKETLKSAIENAKKLKENAEFEKINKEVRDTFLAELTKAEDTLNKATTIKEVKDTIESLNKSTLIVTEHVNNKAPEIYYAEDINLFKGDKLSLKTDDLRVHDPEEGYIDVPVEVKNHNIPVDENGLANKAGEYFVTYAAKDSKGKEGTKTVKATVKEVQSIEESLNRTISYYKKNNNLKYWWEMVALYGAGENLNSGAYKLPVWEKDLVNKDSKVINDAGYILGSIAQGKDVENIDGENWVEVLKNKQNKETGKFGDFNNDQIWSMIALELSNADYSRDKALEHLVSLQSDNGGYGFTTSWPDVDMTGMALVALSYFRGNEVADKSIEKAVNYIKANQMESGSFNKDNSNTIAMAITGLISVGEDVKGTQWKNIPNSLLKLQVLEGNDEGMFLLAPTSIPNAMATQQAFLALGDAKENKTVWNKLKESTKKEVVDKKPLQDKLKEAEDITKDPNFNKIDLNLQKALTSVIEAGKKVLNNEKATSEDVNKAVETLNTEMKNSKDAINAHVTELNNAKNTLKDSISKVEDLSKHKDFGKIDKNLQNEALNTIKEGKDALNNEMLLAEDLNSVSKKLNDLHSKVQEELKKVNENKPGDTNKPEDTNKPGDTNKPEDTNKPGDVTKPEEVTKPGTGTETNKPSTENGNKDKGSKDEKLPQTGVNKEVPVMILLGSLMTMSGLALLLSKKKIG